MPLIAGAIGLGLGGLKTFEDKKRAERQRELEAQLTLYSPWSDLKGDPSRIENVSMLGNMMQGGLAGASFGQSLGANQAAATQSAAKASTPVTQAAQAAPVDAIAQARQNALSEADVPYGVDPETEAAFQALRSKYKQKYGMRSE